MTSDANISPTCPCLYEVLVSLLYPYLQSGCKSDVIGGISRKVNLIPAAGKAISVGRLALRVCRTRGDAFDSPVTWFADVKRRWLDLIMQAQKRGKDNAWKYERKYCTLTNTLPSSY